VIGRLTGKIVSEEPSGAVVIDVSGVGYEVATPVGTTSRASRDGEAVFHVHTHVRQDTFDLYGFASELERRVFRLLIDVPNVGPKSALLLLSALPPADLARAVHTNDLARLTKVPGVGKKTAERLVLELKEKLPRDAAVIEAGAQPKVRSDSERLVIDALTKMGFRAGEAERAVKALGGRLANESPDILLREALKILTPGR
jgi:Holliday junction DNA helicase RuvA